MKTLMLLVTAALASAGWSYAAPAAGSEEPATETRSSGERFNDRAWVEKRLDVLKDDIDHMQQRVDQVFKDEGKRESLKGKIDGFRTRAEELDKKLQEKPTGDVDDAKHVIDVEKQLYKIDEDMSKVRWRTFAY